MRRRGKRRGFSVGFALLVGFAAVLAAGAVLETRVRPIVRSVAQGHLRLEATRFLNEALSSQEAWKTGEAPLVAVRRNEQGEVTDIQTNMAQLSQVRAGITREIAQKVKEFSRQEMAIPLGTLTGSQFFTGRGPKIPFALQQAGDITSQVYHTFEQAGINQTRYQVMLQVTARFTAASPGGEIEAQVSGSVCLAETVIVGRVPDAYTQVETKDTVPGLVADYGT